ncbi:hypothetical protein LQ51_02695 [Micromonospora sp. HK10]|nr:hypothetical protein LQ51_02695 [Micromonospora sp. HK10]
MLLLDCFGRSQLTSMQDLGGWVEIFVRLCPGVTARCLVTAPAQFVIAIRRYLAWWRVAVV